MAATLSRDILDKLGEMYSEISDMNTRVTSIGSSLDTHMQIDAVKEEAFKKAIDFLNNGGGKHKIETLWDDRSEKNKLNFEVKVALIVTILNAIFTGSRFLFKF